MRRSPSVPSSAADQPDLQHNICILTQDNKLFISPAGLDRPLKRVLDAGCGTCIWSVDLADEFPEVSVCGVDLSPIQPDLWVSHDLPVPCCDPGLISTTAFLQTWNSSSMTSKLIGPLSTRSILSTCVS